MFELLDKHVTAFEDTLVVPAPGRTAALHSHLKFGRIIKICLAVSLLTGASFAVLVSQSRVTTDNAVVSAYVVSIRSPIQGEVSKLQLRVGDAAKAAALLAHVSDLRASDTQVVALRGELARNRADRAAFDRQRETLINLRASLSARSEAYRSAQQAYVTASSDEAVAQLLGRSVRSEITRRAMARKVTLARFGDTSLADVDLVTLDARTADADVSSQAAHLASLRVQQAAATNGVFLQSGANDVSYSTQRVDEIDLRLAESERARASLSAGEVDSELRLAAEERRFSAMSGVDLELKTGGMVWKLGVSNGERVASGDILAQVVDCGAAFIVASISQRQFSSVKVGSLAQFRLSGETIDRQGRVLSVTGDSSVSVDRNLAAAPFVDHATTAVARIEILPSGNSAAECLVGRTARVLLPNSDSSISKLLQQWLP